MDDEVLTSEDVARLFKVDAKTVCRWTDQGKIDFFRTPGGHRRFYRADVLALRDGTRNASLPPYRPNDA